jgi:hypothetical protein
MEAGGFQIRLELGKVNGRQSADRFELEDDLPLGHQVETLQSDIHALEENMDFLLALERNGSMVQGDFHGLLINRLHEARPKGLMDVQGGGQDSAGMLPELVSHACLFSRFRTFVLS